MTIIEDVLYIQPCINEIHGIRKQENNVGRIEKIKTVSKQECSSKNKKKDDDSCTYNKHLEYLDYTFVEKKCDRVQPIDFWTNVRTNISNFSDTYSTTIYIMVSHHNRMHDQILKNINNVAYENACVIEIILSKGFINCRLLPDTIVNLDDETNTGILHAFEDFDFNSGSVTIILVRDGNALHDSPLDATGLLDTCLTPFGMYQSQECGKAISKNIKTDTLKIRFITSYLNRSQHTALWIASQINDFTQCTRLQSLKIKFDNDAICRLNRKTNWDNNNNIFSRILPISVIKRNAMMTLIPDDDFKKWVDTNQCMSY